MLKVGESLDGRYEILKKIGSGGMSVVYLAMDVRKWNKQWVIKEINKKTTTLKDGIKNDSLWVEANVLKELDHPVIPRIVDIIDDEGMYYIVMDYIQGDSLDKVLAEYGPQPEEDVIEWAKQLCDGLSYLHRQNPPIIYGDMKPANIMLKPEGTVKIIDFGTAVEKGQKLLLGSKDYAPPEQRGGAAEEWFDIYALGKTLHQLLTGVQPSSGEKGNDLYVSVRQWNPELSEGIEIIIDKCVEREPAKRYQSCAELLYDLEHPALLTADFKKAQKKKVAKFILAASLFLVMLTTGFVCNGTAVTLKNNNYDTLIATTNSIESYKQAIGIFPNDTRAYMRMLEAYEDSGEFGKAQSDEFLALYIPNEGGFDPNSAETATLNYKIGRMYFNYYSGDDGSDPASGFADRVQRAHGYFEKNAVNTELSPFFEEQRLSDCYYQICEFYRKYILNSSTVEEASKEHYEALFTTIEYTMQDIEGAGAYDKLALYNGVFMFMYEQRKNMADVGMEKLVVLALFDKVYEDAKALTTNKEQTLKLQQEIVNNYEVFRDAIVRTYNNTEERA